MWVLLSPLWQGPLQGGFSVTSVKVKRKGWSRGLAVLLSRHPPSPFLHVPMEVLCTQGPWALDRNWQKAQTSS
jgi:hypothetical protein